jgi:hypothetical protein
MKGNYNMILLSIETVADSTTQWFMPKIEADSRLKDPEKVAASLKEKSSKQLKDMKYSPYTAELLFASVYNTDTKESSFLYSSNEKELIKEVVEHIKDKEVCTYCSWEIEFIFKRAIVSGLASYHDLLAWRKKFKDNTSIDLKRVFEFFSNDTSFNLLAGAYAGEQIEDFEDTQVLVNEDDTPSTYVKEYAEKKMNILKKIYEKIS